MALSTSSRVGVTFDETAHLTAGYSYWDSGEYRLQPENGNLPQRLAAMPLLAKDIQTPTWDGEAWNTADVWWFGRELFFHLGNDTAELLQAGRSMIVLLGIALVALVYYWSRRLFGHTGGLLSLGFAVFCPHLLAHGALITSDIAATLGFMLALGSWWKLCHRITLGRIAFTGVAMGFLALAKYSAALFAPIALMMLIVRSFRPTPIPWQLFNHRGKLEGSRRIPAMLGGGVVAAGLAIIIIWSAYGFRYSAAPAADLHFTKPWSEILMETPRADSELVSSDLHPTETSALDPGLVQKFVQWSRDHKLLPEAYLYGLAFTDYHARGRLAYFAGEYRMTGWREFFPVAFALKTTIPTLLLFALALVVFARSKAVVRSRWIYRLTPLLIFVGVYWVFTITSHLNIGHRHLLPIYPALFIMAGVTGSRIASRQSHVLLIATIILLCWHGIESWRVRPHYLTYFNQIAGGPTGGHRYFVDSSLDWGQGLPDLKTWLTQNQHDEPLFLSYFGSDDPQRFDLQATRIGDLYFDYSSRQLLPPLTGGIYCISATMLHRVYTQVRGPWSADHERAYRELAASLSATPGTPKQQETFAQLRFGRLCHFLEQRRADALVGNTFFVYRLTDEEIDIALNSPWQH